MSTTNFLIEDFEAEGEKVLAELGITTEQELYNHLDCDETYQGRIRRKPKGDM
jgi:hypothetical protein